MATRRGKIEQEIAVKVTGAKDAKDLEKTVDDLDGRKAKVTVDATDAVKAERSIDDLMTKVDRLDRQPATLLLTSNATAIASEIADLVLDLDRLDANDPHVDVTVANLNALQSDLDRVESKIREVNATEISPRVDTSRAVSGLNDLDRANVSAGKSSSVFANTVGNTSQDIGELGGIAGTAGVAIGQMGEYIADSAAEGEKLSSVLGSFAKVAVPIAAITAGVAGLKGRLERAAATEAFKTDAIDNYVDAIQEGESALTSLEERLRDLGELELNIDIGQGLRLDVTEALVQAGLSLEQFSQLVEGGEERIEDWAEAAARAGVELETVQAVTALARQEVGFYADAQKNAAIQQQLFGNGHSGLVDILRRGMGAWQAHAEEVVAANQRERESLERVIEFRKSQADAESATTQRIIQLAEQRRQALEDEAVAVAETQQAINDLSGEFAVMGRRQEALSSIFEIGNAGIEAVGEIHDVETAIRDLATFITDEGVPDILDPDDVDAGPFLDKIAGLRGPIQEAVTNAFAAGGPAAAIEVADKYVARIVEALGGKLTEEQVRQLLNLDDLQATIDLAINQESLLTAQATLALLTGLNGQTPYTASIALALNAGEISPAAAQVLVNDALRGEGVEVPAALAGVETAQARAEAQSYLQRHPLLVPSTVQPPSTRDFSNALSAVQRFMSFNPLVQPVRYTFQGMANFDAGTPSVPYPGGIAGERGPEILNDRYVTDGPTLVPPGTRVTSRVRTATILRSPGHGGRRLKMYDAGGTVPVPPPLNVTINAGVIGNRYDVSRTVERAVRDGYRLRGQRP